MFFPQASLPLPSSKRRQAAGRSSSSQISISRSCPTSQHSEALPSSVSLTDTRRRTLSLLLHPIGNQLLGRADIEATGGKNRADEIGQVARRLPEGVRFHFA